MFDPQKILQQVLGGSGDSGGQEERKRGISADTLKGATIGGLAGLLLGSKSARKIAGPALQMGGVAVLGGLAYKAWQNWQAQQNGQLPAPNEKAANRTDGAEGTMFLPKLKAERDELSLTLLSAMISAAKSDGHIDAAEQDRIFARIGDTNLSAEEKGFLMDQIRQPLDINAIAAKATTPERAAEIYAVSVLAIDVDDPKEADYLKVLASHLDLDSGLRASIEAEAGKAMRPA